MKETIMRYGILLLVSISLLAACSGVPVTEYRDYQPRLIPEVFFNGKLTAHGVVKNRSGKVTRYFNATINAWWEDGTGYLDEDFFFNDGEKQKRLWTLQKSGEDTYTATAGDVVGTGKGTISGNSMFLEYVLRLPYKDGQIDITFDDRMYLVNENTIINESVMYKFGFEVGSISLVIMK
jgi:hypothetical protein